MSVDLPVLETERLVLRPYYLADARRAQEMCGDWAVASTTFNLPHPYPDGAAEKWISTHVDSFRQGTEVTLAITLKPDRPVIGSVALSVNKNHQRGELGYMVAREHWNRGYCTEVARTLMSYGFSALGLNRIQAMHFPSIPTPRYQQRRPFRVGTLALLTTVPLYPHHLTPLKRPRTACVAAILMC